VVVPQESLSKLTFLHRDTSSSRFAIRGGATGKSCEGWMGPIPMGTHVASASRHVLPYVMVPHESHVRGGWDLFQWEPCVSPCFAIRGRSVSQRCEARMHSIQTESI
jgi:hypothetical protein